MATSCIALLRGINVGPAKRVAMADLRQLLTSLGYGDVRTLLNSGNAVFTAKGAAVKHAGPRIEAAIAAELGVTARVMMLTGAELADAVSGNPFLARADHHSRMMVGILDNVESAGALQEALRQDWHPGALAVRRRVVYYWCPEGILESPLAAAVAKALKDRVTTRNWNTLLKLQALAEA